MAVRDGFPVPPEASPMSKLFSVNVGFERVHPHIRSDHHRCNECEKGYIHTYDRIIIVVMSVKWGTYTHTIGSSSF